MASQRSRRRPTKAETRDRLLDGATLAFAERGFNAASQDEICSRVGLTRGAFNSCFTSKDELFLALYDRMIERVGDRIRAALAVAVLHDDLDTRRFTRELVSHYPIDRDWHVLSAEFNLYAIRHPAVAVHLAKRRAVLLDAIGDAIEQMLQRQHRRLTVDPNKLARLLLAIHDGNLSQSLVEPDRLYPGEFFMLFGPDIILSSSTSVAIAGPSTFGCNDTIERGTPAADEGCAD